MKVSTVSQMREMDQAAIHEYGISDVVLMENAGLAAYRVLASRQDVVRKRTLIFCGSGNNGGDGLVIARHVHSAGGSVCVVLMSGPEKYQGASNTNYQMLTKLGVESRNIEQEDDLQQLFAGADIVVDAILGTGIERAVSGRYADVIEQINRSDAWVLSVDIPSGIQGDTGQIMETAVHADATVTFGLPKLGNLLPPGWIHCGDLYVSHISFPPTLYESKQLLAAVNTPAHLPPRAEDGHKGSFGQSLFIAGAASYFGAPFLSSMSFLKAGGGYSRLATPAKLAATLATMGCEIVFMPQAETDDGSLAAINLDNLVELANSQDFVVIGPGVSLNDETQHLVRDLVSAIETPVLIDGDGISAIASDLDCVRRRSSPTVITPHLGEMSRLTGLSVAEIQNDRITPLRDLCTELRATVVLKGSHTLVGHPDGRIRINMTGNSGMGSAGTGDVLTGAIVAMHGLGLSFDDAVNTGVFLHGLAGDLAAEAVGKDGMTATDVLSALPAAVRLLREDPDSPALKRYSIPVVS